MAEGKAIDKANLELALSENNRRALEYIDAADNKIRRQLNRSNFIFVDDYDPCNGIITEGLTYYIDFLDSYRSPDVSYVYNVINNEQYAQNNGVFINNKKGVFGNSQYLHAQDIKIQYPVTLEFLLQFDSSKNQIVFFENYSPRIVCGYWSTYFSGRHKGGKTFLYDFSELTNKVNLLTICYENEDTMTIYVNGVKLEEQDKTDTWNTSTFTGTYIGRRSYSGSANFQGNMYRIRIYDRILAQEEILSNYTADMEFVNSSIEYGKQYNLNILGYENEVIGIEDTPVGHTISHMGMEVPKHYLACDGSEYNIADYTYLAEHILNEFGSYNYFGGDGINTFCVPNLNINTENDTVYGLVPQMNNYYNNTCIVTQGSEYSTAYKGYYAFDRSDSTGWFANNTVSDYIQIEFIDSKVRKIDKISLRNIKYGSVNRCKDFEVQASEDGINFDTLLTDVLPDDDVKYYDYELVSNIRYKFFRIIVYSTHTTGNSNRGLGDIRLFGAVLGPFSYIKYEPTYFCADNVTVQYINTDEKLEQEIALLEQILDELNGEVV